MTATAPTEAPTFGNLRKPRAPGLNNLSFVVTGLLGLGLLVFILLSLTAGIVLAGAELGAVLLVAVLLSVKDADELTILQRVSRRLAFRRGRKTGSNLLRAGLLGQVPGGQTQLPGLAAQSSITTAWDSYGREFVMVHHPATSDYAVVFGVEPDGDALVDPWVVANRVAYWGAFLASLSDEPGLQAWSVTIESAPDTGHRLRRSVLQAIDPGAPPFAQAVLNEIIVKYPQGSASIRAYLTLTFSAATKPGADKRPTADVARDLASRLPKLMDRLQMSGAGYVRMVTADELCEIVRVAYDPLSAPIIEAARANDEPLDLQWDEVGPIGADNQRDHYIHDGAVSATWQMNRPPKGTFHSNVLGDLLAPHHDIPRKRVTLFGTVLPSGKAADAVQRDVDDTTFREESSKSTAVTRKEKRAAEKSAEEEAAGAGVVNIGMLVTATVVDPGLQPGQRVTKHNRTRAGRLVLALDDAISAVDSLGSGAKIRLRRPYGAQDSAFTAALPIGLHLDRHMRLPQEIRDAL